MEASRAHLCFLPRGFLLLGYWHEGFLPVGVVLMLMWRPLLSRKPVYPVEEEPWSPQKCVGWAEAPRGPPPHNSQMQT